MQAYAKIENVGEVDINAFRLIGASSKENDSTKIGFFGSGIKYAIASALRLGIPLRVFSGKKEIKITIKEETMRGEKFDVVCINGEMTSITTRMGKDWQVWFILREFLCNAIDEGEHKLGVSNKPTGEAGKTLVYIGLTDEMKKVFDNMDLYFSHNRKAVHKTTRGEIYHRLADKMTIYRKGIRVFNNGASIYDYNFPDIAINESRVSSDWDVNWHILTFWKLHASVAMVNMLTQNKNSFEFHANWEYGAGEWEMSQGWVDALKGITVIPQEHSGYFADDLSERHVMLPHKLCLILHKAFGKKLKIRGMEADKAADITYLPMGAKEKQMLKNASDFLMTSPQFKDLTSFPVQLAALEKGVLGKVIEGTIVLDVELFHKGLRAVVETLLEEYVHAKSLAADRTREMQDFLIRCIVSSIEEKTNYYL